MTVTFFGHRDAPFFLRDPLYQTLKKLIEEENAVRFYIGNEGNFDKMALSALQKLKTVYPQIHYDVVLAYLPQKASNALDDSNTIFPAEIAATPARFAIDQRNLWMIQQSDTVVTYVTHAFGGAAKFKKKARAQGKLIIELALPPSPTPTLF